MDCNVLSLPFCDIINKNNFGDDLMKNKIDKLTQILKESNNIVFFGGAGVSTDMRI